MTHNYMVQEIFLNGQVRRCAANLETTIRVYLPQELFIIPIFPYDLPCPSTVVGTKKITILFFAPLLKRENSDLSIFAQEKVLKKSLVPSHVSLISRRSARQTNPSTTPVQPLNTLTQVHPGTLLNELGSASQDAQARGVTQRPQRGSPASTTPPPPPHNYSPSLDSTCPLDMAISSSRTCSSRGIIILTTMILFILLRTPSR